jgi:hypothetical protein
METIITLVVFIAGFITGTLVARNNIKKINSIVEDAEDFAAAVDRKIDKLRDEVTKKPTKRGRPATKK